MDHMWLMYLQFFVEDLEFLPPNTAVQPNPISDGSDMKEKLIFTALTTLASWVELASRLPIENPHRVPTIASEANDAIAIPFWAAKSLCIALKTVLLSPKFGDDFKVSCLSSFVLTGARRIQKDSYLRILLADGLLEGSSRANKEKISDKIKALRSRLDLTHLLEFNELEDQLK